MVVDPRSSGVNNVLTCVLAVWSFPFWDVNAERWTSNGVQVGRGNLIPPLPHSFGWSSVNSHCQSVAQCMPTCGLKLQEWRRIHHYCGSLNTAAGGFYIVRLPCLQVRLYVLCSQLAETSLAAPKAHRVRLGLVNVPNTFNAEFLHVVLCDFLPCGLLGFESAVIVRNDEFKAVFIARIHAC